MEKWSRSRADLLFDYGNTVLFVVVLLITMYPLYFMIIASISDPLAVNLGQVWLLPKDMTWEGYRRILENERIWTGYSNSLVYAAAGASISVVLLVSGGYALSRKDLDGRNLFMMLIVFTMFFQGGLIPTYLLVKNLGMLNTIWALIIPNAISVFQLIICRTYFQTTIPDELLEAAFMDGCTNFKFLIKIVLPLSLPIIAVMILFNVVSHWNAYFQALIYMRDESKYPLQIVLREILIQSEADTNEGGSDLLAQQRIKELVKYGVIMVATLPVLILYPFLQKYFVKGMMIGSVKG